MMETKLLILFAILVIIIILILAPNIDGIVASAAVALILAIIMKMPKSTVKEIPEAFTNQFGNYTDADDKQVNVANSTSDIPGSYPDNQVYTE